MTDTLCLHHADADGHCAGAIVKYMEKDVTLYPMNYGYKIPWSKIKEAKKVYMVDFGCQPFSNMVRILNEKGDNFIWIDHHITAIDDMEKSGRSFKGIQRIGDAGCELTWEYFNDLYGSNRPMPEIVKMIGRYDVWDTNYSPHLFDVQAALKLYDIEGDSDDFWKKHFENDTEINDLIQIGDVCNQYQRKLHIAYVDSHSFEMEWQGLRFLVCNAMNTNSKLFDSKFNSFRHDAVLTFGYTNKNWTVSMYTDQPGINVGAIAKKYGGGGHEGAAGFQIRTLPFELKIKR